MNATRFLQHVNQNQTLAAQLASANWDTEAIIAIAAAQGFTFGASELQTAIDSAWGTLSEEELRNAAGGHHDHDHDGHGDGDGDGNGSTCSFYYGGG